MVLTSGEEQEGGPVGVLVIDVGVVVARVDVRERAAPEDPAGGGDVVTLVQSARLLLVEGVREDVAPLLEREPDRLVAVRRILEHRER
jgi:hypothetical protein